MDGVRPHARDDHGGGRAFPLRGRLSRNPSKALNRKELGSEEVDRGRRYGLTREATKPRFASAPSEANLGVHESGGDGHPLPFRRAMLGRKQAGKSVRRKRQKRRSFHRTLHSVDFPRASSYHAETRAAR